MEPHQLMFVDNGGIFFNFQYQKIFLLQKHLKKTFLIFRLKKKNKVQKNNEPKQNVLYLSFWQEIARPPPHIDS